MHNEAPRSPAIQFREKSKLNIRLRCEDVREFKARQRYKLCVKKKKEEKEEKKMKEGGKEEEEEEKKKRREGGGEREEMWRGGGREQCP